MLGSRAPMEHQSSRSEDEVFFRALDASADAVSVTRVSDTAFIYVNRAFCQLSGFEASEVLGRPALELDVWADPSDRDAIVAALAEQVRTGIFEVSFRNKRGETLQAIVSAELVEMGGEPCVLTLARDVTDHRRLQQQVDLLASIVESSTDAIIGKTLDGVITSWNRGAEEMYGYTSEEAIGQPISLIVPPDRRGEVDRMLRAVRRGRRIEELETVRVRKGGARIEVALKVSPITDPRGRITGASAIARDITGRKVTEDALRQAELRYRSLVERIPAVTYVDAVDRTSSALYVSPQIEDLLGYPAERWRQEPDLWIRLVHPEDRDRVLAEHERTNATGEPFAMEYRLTHRDGHEVWVHDEALLVRNEGGTAQFWQGVMLDVTERKRAEEELAYLAYHDQLTGLPNRAMLEDLLGLALARARRADLAVAVVYADLDDFKSVNDALGHQAGDEVLRQVAARMREVARATDVVGRVGGDEFLVLLADLASEGPAEPEPREVALAVAERIGQALGEPFAVAGTHVTIGASSGVALYPKDAQTAEELLALADAAMYQGKPRVVEGSDQT